MPTTPHARHRLPGLLAFSLFTLSAALVASAGQPPEEEEAAPKAARKAVKEDEDAKGGIKKKVVIDDDQYEKRPGNKPDVLLDELAQAAAVAPPALKAVYTRYAVPFDRMTDAKGQASRVKPIPLYKTDALPAEFKVTELNDKGQPKEARSLTRAEVKGFEPFELLVLAEADRLGKDQSAAPGISPDDRLMAGEKLIAAALRFHDYARAAEVRRGKAWDEAKTALTTQLKDNRIRQVQRATGVSDWVRAQEAGNRLMAAYPGDAAVEKEVAASRVAAAEGLFKSGTHPDKVRVRELVDEFDAVFPGGGGEPMRKVRAALTAEAKQLVELAYGAKATDKTTARNNVNRAEALDPNIPGLRELRNELGSASATLYVGARVFPERLSPATARWDSEKQVVELLFEGLYEVVPGGEAGDRYRPGAALGYPLVTPGGRDALIRQAGPSAGTGGFDTSDVVQTVKLLQGRPAIWPSAGLPWLDDLPAPATASAVRLGFRHGHPDPRALLTFKLLPGRLFAANGKPADDSEYAARPVGGTGPFRVQSLPPPGTTGPRELVLTENPAYGRWKDRTGLPKLREVRFIELSKVADPLAEFKGGRLHIIPDLTREEMYRAVGKGQSEFGGKAQVVTAWTNRRVQILAVNYRRAHLQSKALRRGLSLALDREEIVNDVFGKGLAADQKRFLAAMTGPFPPSSWATVKGQNGQPVPLDNRPAGINLLKEYLNAPGAVNVLELAYATTDPLSKLACERIKAQIEGLPDGQRLATPEGKPLTIELKPLAARDLLVQVQDEHRFDLAYMPFEYPDDWYPYGLAAMLDPAAAGRGGRNWTGFLSAKTNPSDDDRNLGGELSALLIHRDFEAQLRPRAERIHNYFNATVPFVPLWQLDRHMLVPAGLRVVTDDTGAVVPPKVLNQTTLFSNAGRWQLE